MRTPVGERLRPGGMRRTADTLAADMHLDVVLPDESPTMPASALVELVRTAEELGYHTAYLPDHVLPPGEYGATFGGVYEPLVTLAHLAAVTSRIRLGTSVLVVPLRNPFVLAKQVATLQHLSSGRAVLGVGTGWSEEEFTAVGAAYRRRGSSTDEALALIRHLFTVGRGPYVADGFGFDQGVFAPVPEQAVAVLTGGNSDAALRRAATHADLWQGMPVPPEQFGVRVQRLRDLTDGRRPVSPGLRLQWDDDRAADRVADEIDAYRIAGADHVAVHFGDYRDSADRMTTLAHALGLDT